MLSLLYTGHERSCPVFQNQPCSHQCRKKLFRTSGFLAIAAGFITSLLGYYAGSFFTLSEAAHVAIDSLADFYGAHIEGRVEKHGHRETDIRKQGSVVIALLLFLAAIFILVELFREHHTLIPRAMILAGIIGTGINLLRSKMLQGREVLSNNKTRTDLIRHARSDVFHSTYVAAVGIVFLIFEKHSIIAIPIGPWLVSPIVIDYCFGTIVAVYLTLQAIAILTGKSHHH
jgi:Co/Zn/Cd efflux system component